MLLWLCISSKYCYSVKWSNGSKHITSERWKARITLAQMVLYSLNKGAYRPLIAAYPSIITTSRINNLFVQHITAIYISSNLTYTAVCTLTYSYRSMSWASIIIATGVVRPTAQIDVIEGRRSSWNVLIFEQTIRSFKLKILLF